MYPVNTAPAAQLSFHEHMILRLDRYPWSALYRIGLGYAIPLLYFRTFSKENPEWLLLPWFLCCLIALRVFPAILRKVLPFTREVKAKWAERRGIAKLYDSYQWRKLLWFGTGMAGYVALSGSRSATVGSLTIFCL